MISYDPTPLLDGDDRHDVWFRVLDALEDALDIEGMPAQDRAALTRLHVSASTWVGDRPLELPADWTLPPHKTAEALTADHESRARWKRADRPDGVFRIGLPRKAQTALFRAGLLTLSDLRDAIESGTLAMIPGVGSKSLQVIHEAIGAPS